MAGRIRTGAMTIPLLATAALAWPAAIDAQSSGGPAAGYPGSRLQISVSSKARAGSVVTVRFSGTNARFTEGAPIAYTLEAFVQARSVLPTCPRSYAAELNNVINLGSRSILQIATNLNEGVEGPFRFTVKYRSGSTRRVVFCAYSRLITDDAAYAQLRRTLRPVRRARRR